jgi:signal transduction histidine kinase/ActR/RegA family two-component response regulator
MKLASNLIRIISVTAIFASFLAAFVLIRTLPPEVLSFRFNWYALVYIVCTLIFITLLVFLRAKQNRNRVTFWLSVFTSFEILLTLSGLLLCMSADVTAYAFWYHMFSFFAILNVLTLFFFILSYTGYEDYLYRPFTWVSILGSAFFITYIDSTTTLFNDTMAVVRTNWGYPPFPPQGRYYIIFLLWIQVFLISGVVMLIYHYRKVRANIRKRKQTLLVVIGMLLTPVLGTFFGIVVPAIGIQLPPLLPVIIAIQVSIVGYAILRYNVFTIQPAALSDIVLGTMNESVIAINSYREIEHINPKAIQMLRITDQSVLGKHLDKVFAPETAKLIIQKLKEGKNEAFELELTLGTGTIPISLLMSAINDQSGVVVGYILVFRDITKERAAKSEIERQVVERTEQVHEEQLKLKASIDSLSLGFIMIDANDKILLSNEAVNYILSDAPSEWTLPALAGRFGEDFDFEAACMQVRKSKEKKYIKKISLDNKILRVFLSPVTYRAGAVGIVALFEDITEQEVLNRSKDEFFSIASHELRTPLTAIRGNASMIMDLFAEHMKDKELEEMVQDIHGSSTRLIDIVNDFLDVSRLEQGKVTYLYEEVALDEIVEQVMYEMNALLQEKHLSLEFDNKTLGVLPKVWSDKNRLKQIVYNLIGNAAKFTDKGSISIEAKVEGSLLKVYVIDTGRGISLDGQKLLFHKFQQAGNSLLTRDTTRGTGLGLYISKMMVENMGGTMALEHSEEGKGSTFSFTMPIASDAVKHTEAAAVTDSATGLTVAVAPSTQPVATKPQLESVKAPGVASKTHHAPKLLIIEDDPYVVRLYQRLFSSGKIEVKTAGNGRDGVALAKSYQPGLILLDVMMPIMNGIEALEELKASPATSHIPVMILSSFGEEKTVQNAMQKGAISYLVKSDFTPEQILNEVQKILKKDGEVFKKLTH